MATPRIDPGTLVGGRFRVEELAGTGGMGEVYRGRDVSSAESVAIKFVHASNLAPRFLREARVLAQLEHPGIVRYVAHGDTPSIFLVMEWLEGEDLAERLRGGPLGIRDTVALARGVSEALSAAHVRGVVHRDIKPSNIFLPGKRIDRLKLLDFGIAAFAEGTRVMTITGQVLGTLGYMAPEQAASGRDVTARADVFSLGCVLFECVTGRPAFPGDRLMEVLAKILFAETPRAGDLREDVPHALDDLLARMMRKDPEQRPSLAAVGAELEALGALGTLPTSRAARRPPQSRRRPTGAEGPAVTDAERRLMAVVLVDPGVSARVRPTSPTISIDHVRDVAVALGEAVAPFEGRLEMLAHGASLVVLTATEAATDLATRAARVGLAVRRIIPTAPVAVALGKGDPSAEEQLGELVTRAENLLEASIAASTDVTIVLDEVVGGLLDGRFETRAGPHGAALLGERGAADAAFSRSLLGKATPCVGRDRELSMLQAVADECFGEPLSEALLVTGAAGTGKSRLAHEFVRALAAREPRLQVWSARGDPIAAGSSFALLGQLVHGLAGLADGEPADVRREKLSTRVGRHLGPDAALRAAELLGELVGARFPDEGRPTLRAARQDAALMGDQLRRVWEELLAAETSVGPLVLLLDDLQWGDRPSVRFVEVALRALDARPLLAIALARPEVHETFPGLWRDRRVHEVRVGELSPNAARRLASFVLGERVGRAAVDALVEKAGGNAFYLEELIRTVAEGGEALPETVLAMAQARLERLEPDARRLLRAASIFGKTFWPSGVAVLLGASALGGRTGDAERRAALDAALADLVKAEVIQAEESSRFQDEPQYAFRQLLVRDAAYGMLTERDRRLGHKLAADWLESRGERDAIVLAEHFDRGGHGKNAVVWYLWAAEQAFEGNDLPSVITRAERGVACGASGATLGELRLLQAEALGWSGRPETREAHGRYAEAAMTLLEPGSAAWCRAAAELAAAAAKSEDMPRLRDIAERLAALPPDATVSLGHGFSMARAAIDLLIAGQTAHADRLILWVVAAAEEAHADDRATFATIVAWLKATRALLTGDPAPYLAEGPGLLAALEAGGHLRYTAIVALYLSAACAVAHEFADGLGWANRAAEVADRLGLTSFADLVPSHRALHEAALAESDESFDELTLPASAHGHAGRVLTRILFATTVRHRGD